MTDKQKNLALTITHILAVVVAVATAISAVGPDKIAQLFSKDPVQVTTAACALIVAVAAAVVGTNTGTAETK